AGVANKATSALRRARVSGVLPPAPQAGQGSEASVHVLQGGGGGDRQSAVAVGGLVPVVGLLITCGPSFERLPGGQGFGSDDADGGGVVLRGVLGTGGRACFSSWWRVASGEDVGCGSLLPPECGFDSGEAACVDFFSAPGLGQGLDADVGS